MRNKDKYLNSNAEDHRITELSFATINANISGYDLVIKDGFDESQINGIVKKINFSTAKYELSTTNTAIHAAAYGATAFRNFIIWGAVAFSIIAIMLMVNYGLLGALATISLALFTFITLTLFTVMRGEYSPEAIAAMIVGLGLSLDVNISTFERLKSEIYLGQNLGKANKTAFKKSI